MVNPERHIIVEEQPPEDKALAYVLAHIDRKFELLEKHINERMPAALQEHTKRMSTDSDMAQPYWHKGADHIGERAKDGLVKWIGGKVLTALLTALAVGLAAFGVQYWGRK